MPIKLPRTIFLDKNESVGVNGPARYDAEIHGDGDFAGAADIPVVFPDVGKPLRH